jgi:ABC-type Mn2+/Zn2+ transport system permease subunit
MLTILWVAVGVAVVIAVLGFTIARQQQARPLKGRSQAALPGLKRTVFDLQLGDIVQ